MDTTNKNLNSKSRYELKIEGENITLLQILPEKREYPLKRVSKELVRAQRKEKIPSFILKLGEELYYSEIAKDSAFSSTDLLQNPHKCGECDRMNCCSDECGGCKKVRDGCFGIENYPFIIRGYETMFIEFSCFVVSECTNYERPKKKKKTHFDCRFFSQINENTCACSRTGFKKRISPSENCRNCPVLNK